MASVMASFTRSKAASAADYQTSFGLFFVEMNEGLDDARQESMVKSYHPNVFL